MAHAQVSGKRRTTSKHKTEQFDERRLIGKVCARGCKNRVSNQVQTKKVVNNVSIMHICNLEERETD